MQKTGKSRRLIGLLMLLVSLVVLSLGVSAASDAALNKTKLSLFVGKSYTLKVSGTEEQVTWSTSRKSVATVNSRGKVTAKKKGTAVITATTGEEKISCTVTVKQPVNSIKLNQTNIAISAGKTYTLKATVKPTSANNRAVKWSSSNKSVVKVSSKGKLTAVSAGTAVITAKAKDGSGRKVTCKVTVKTPVTEDESVTLKLSKTTLTLTEGKSRTLTATSTGNVSIAWGTSDRSVATVSGGKVTAKSTGTATIAARRVDGKKTVFCKVTVKAAEENTQTSDAVTTNQTGASANAGKFLQILQKYSDQVKTDAANGITWSYSNSSAPSTWSAAYKASRTKGITYCNCALLPRWALREMGVINSKNFWGLAGGGIQFRGDVKSQLEKYCDIIKVYKTPNQLLADGNLLPGDICTWVEYQHTNVYAGNSLWYDAGRGVNYSNGAFTSFGPSAAINMSGTTVGYIIRFR